MAPMAAVAAFPTAMPVPMQHKPMAMAAPINPALSGKSVIC
jgi:hypothetical protein